MKHEESPGWPFSRTYQSGSKIGSLREEAAVDPKFKDQMKMANSLIGDSWEARESQETTSGKWRMVEQWWRRCWEAEEVVPKGPDVMPPLDVLTNKIDSDNTQSLLAFTNDAQSGETVPTAVLGSPSRSQAQVIPWPSNDLWSMGFKTLSGLGTIDKFMREPSIFNPIMGIEDCRSLEYDFGPKKGKALDASKRRMPFLSWSSRDTTGGGRGGRLLSRSRQGCCSSNPQSETLHSSEGRPPKDAQSHGPKTFSLKRQARNTVKETRIYRACIIEEMKECIEENVTSSSGFFRFGAKGSSSSSTRVSKARWAGETALVDGDWLGPMQLDPRVFWVVKTAWMTQSHRDPMVNMYRKIKATKEHLRRWNKTHFRKLATQISEAQTRLKDIEGNQSMDQVSHDKARLALNEALAREEIFRRQKSRVRGEGSIADFNWHHDMLSLPESEELYLIPSIDEVLCALMSMGGDKAPGRDGIPAAFFRSHWDTIRDDLMVNDYCLISLCNVVYKYISKILALRLCPILPNLISPTQTAFIKGRSIAENTAMAQEIVHSMAKKRGSERIYLWLNFDMEKAYDKMDWNRMWNKSIMIGPSHYASYVCDGVMLFGQASVKEADAFLQCLEIYCDWSGQAVNFQKSTISFSKGVPINRANLIASKLGMKRMPADTVYLGFLRSMKRTRDFRFLVKKVQTRVEGWKAKLLSKAGRACLVQSIGNSLSLYAAATEVIPSSIATSIDRCLRSFWWGDHDSKRTLHTIDWSSLCKSKFHGGLGFRQTKDINKAFLLKWGWKLIMDPSSLWCSTMKEKYLKESSFWDVQLKSSDSRLWKAIVKARPLLSEGMCRRIGDGRSTSIWFDSWVPLGNHQPSPKLNATQGANLVSYFINDDQTWNVARIRAWFDSTDATNILNIGLPALKQEDSWQWLGEKRGTFSIKSAYYLIIKHRCAEVPHWHWKFIWNYPIHARLKLLWWQIMNNSLPTHERIGMVFNIPCTLCPLCDEEMESSFHVLWQCNFAKAVWFGSLWGIRTNLSQCGNWSEWLDWVKDSSNRPDTLSFEDFITGALCIFESIWKVLGMMSRHGAQVKSLRQSGQFVCDTKIITLASGPLGSNLKLTSLHFWDG
uniref:Reverse transcriptase domain-containing protein n=1 Tax=Cannabis sativa TaxID=3483 RepID=A0A803P4U5_CANSA